MSLQLTSGSGKQTHFEAALRLNWRSKNLTLLSYSYCITGISKPVGTRNINFETYYTGGFPMNINTKNLVSITEANQNFSKVARLVDESGAVVILKNNVPRYLVMEFSAAEQEQLAADEDVMSISKRLIEKNRQAYEVLAK